MKGIIKSGLVTGLLAMCLMSNVYATDNKTINKTILKSEESSFLTSIEQEMEENETKYKLSNYFKEDDTENSKIVTAYKKDVIKSNTKESIISHFGDNLNYEDEEYSGVIALKDYDIKTISNGKYEAIDEKKINFNKYSKNDLDNIEKEKVIGGVTYSLINVNWKNDETENIDGQEVPITYKGTMIYQAVVTRNNPYSYEITVTYEGSVERKDPIYLYTLEYEKIQEEPIIEIIEETKDYTVPTIIISGLGIALVVVYCIGKTTARVYVKTDNGFKLIRVVRLSKKHNTINLSNYKHKTVTNMFAIKTTNGFYNKNQNILIKIKKDKITKNVYLNSAYIDFILGNMEDKMELENATIIDFGEVELLANKEELYMGFKNEAKFKINWCRLKDKPDQLICLNIECDKLSEEIKEKEIPIVNITEMIRLQFMELLEKELNSFIGKNINNISYFFEKDEYTDANRNKYYANPEFLKISDIGIDFFNENASIEQKSKVHTSFCIYDEINKSKLKYKPSAYYSEKIVEIDMKENKILTEPSTIMNLVYSEVDLCKILAYKQYELGITPPFYNEIAKINRFLKDKKTITVLLKDNTEIKIEADITDIIDFYNGVFSINRNLLNLSYDEANREKVDINNLKALRHGKTEISINTENLKPLEQQLDEIIHNENKGIICNITNQELENEDQGDTNEI